MEQGRLAGIEMGMEEGRRELSRYSDRLSEISGKMLEEKERLLRDHETQWCRAFSHLLKRFLVPRNMDIISELGRWLDESLENFSTVHKVRIFLSPEDYELVQKHARPVDGHRFEVVSDSNLGLGQIHCETDAGGLFFAPSKESEKLEDLILHFVTIDTRTGE